MRNNDDEDDFLQETKPSLLSRLNPFSRSSIIEDPNAGYRYDDDKLAQDFAANADAAMLSQDPLRARNVIWGAFLAFVLLITWAALAEVDEITRGEGRAVSSLQLQIVQSLDGGIVKEILVKEGERVTQGQILFRIDATRFTSDLNESRATYLALLAKAARLRAIAEGGTFQAPAEVLKEEPSLIDQERMLYQSRRAELDSRVSMARAQVTQRTHELGEVRARYDSLRQSHASTAKELEMTRPLISSGAVSDVELLRLEREVNNLKGEMNQATAQTTRLQSAIAEAKTNIREVELQFRNEARSELAETQARINSLSQGTLGLTDKVKQANIKSPVNGTVQRLLHNTVGGVVQPGKDIIEIVPLDDSIILETKVLPKDIAFLHPGQKANVKFTAYDFSIYGGMEAVVDNISADTVKDDKGNTFYIVRVRTLKSQIGDNMPILPGMIAEVNILTGKKTVLSYLLKPVLKAKQYALTER